MEGARWPRRSEGSERSKDRERDARYARGEPSPVSDERPWRAPVAQHRLSVLTSALIWAETAQKYPVAAIASTVMVAMMAAPAGVG